MCCCDDDEEPCCDGNSLKIPCCPPIPPFRFHYFLLLIAIACGVFCYLGPDLGNQQQGDRVSPLLHSNCIYLAMTVFGLMICCTILHESGHAFATKCAPGGRVRHIMLNPCCGGHAFVGHTGGELWEAWVAFAGPIWDISLAFLFYLIQVSTDDEIAYSIGLKDYLPMECRDLQLNQLIQANTVFEPGHGFQRHFLDDNRYFWRIALAILMDFQFVTFCFNMLPIMTLDGADFFGSWFRLCTTPVATAIFLICTSLICILGLVIWQLVLPALDVYNRWDNITVNPKWADEQVKMMLLSGIFILMKMGGFLGPVFKLCGDTCKRKLNKYHVFQQAKWDREQRKRESAIPMYENQQYSARAMDY